MTYHWKINGRWNLLQAMAQEIMRDMSPGSLDEFIAEHYWGYSTQRDGSTVAYQVEHPRWQIRDVSAYQYDCDVAPLYGQQFVTTLTSEPASIFIAEGSDVIIRNGVRLA